MPISLALVIFTALSQSAVAAHDPPPTDNLPKDPSPAKADYCNGAADEYESPQDGWYFTWENDAMGVIKTDSSYTQGAQTGYTFRNQDLPRLARIGNSIMCRVLGFAHDGVGRAKTLSSTALFLGQQLYTPKDTSRTDPIPDDRPYAGWTYIGGRMDMVQALQLGAEDHRRWRTHTLELHLGVVGPTAQGKATQTKFHHLLSRIGQDSDEIRGWDNQIQNQWGMQAYYGYSTRLTSYDIGSMIGDVLFTASAAVGNLQIYGETGLTLRFGRNMAPLAQRAMVPSIANMTMHPLDTDPTESPEINAQRARISRATDTRPCSWLRAEECYAFVGFNARGVARNRFLEPTQSGAGLDIEHDPFVYDMVFGGRVRFKRFRVDFIETLRSREFSPNAGNPLEKKGRHDFGSLTMSCYGNYGDRSDHWELVCPGIVAVIAGLTLTLGN